MLPKHVQVHVHVSPYCRYNLWGEYMSKHDKLLVLLVNQQHYVYEMYNYWTSKQIN